MQTCINSLEIWLKVEKAPSTGVGLGWRFEAGVWVLRSAVTKAEAGGLLGVGVVPKRNYERKASKRLKREALRNANGRSGWNCAPSEFTSRSHNVVHQNVTSQGRRGLHRVTCKRDH